MDSHRERKEEKRIKQACLPNYTELSGRLSFAKYSLLAYFPYFEEME
jgi:hypothetical protein